MINQAVVYLLKLDLTCTKYKLENRYLLLTAQNSSTVEQQHTNYYYYYYLPMVS